MDNIAAKTITDPTNNKYNLHNDKGKGLSQNCSFQR